MGRAWRREILPYLAQLAKGLDASLVLLSVIDPESVSTVSGLGPATGGRGLVAGDVTSAKVEAAVRADDYFQDRSPAVAHESGGPYATQAYDRAESDAMHWLEVVAAQLPEEGIPIVVVSFGRPAEEIVRVARSRDLIAMATHGRGALSRGLLGSVTDEVVHTSSLPTLTVRPDRAMVYEDRDATVSSILVPLDGSTLAETVLPYVEELALRLELKVTLVRAVQHAPVYADGLVFEAGTDASSEAESAAVEDLTRTATNLREKGLNVEWKLLRGSPSRSIVDLARATPQDFIALTTHGHTGMTRWLLGSVAEALVRSAGDPVLIIPPGPLGGEE